MIKSEIENKLDDLWFLRNERDKALANKQALIDSVITDEIKAKIADIEAEFAASMEEINKVIPQTEREIEAATLEYGESVKGKYIHAIYTGGRVTWDSKGLEKAIEVIPSLAQYRKKGEPYITLRKV